ncbi:MAG: ribose 5-phosphate isomerase B [Leptospirales bacterium]
MEFMIGIVSDHGGFEMKEFIRENFPELQWKDYGCFSEDSVDYPDMGQMLAKGVLAGEVEKGIAICGTGIGISISLNRYKKIRAALCHDVQTVEMARRHNNANILALGGRILKKELVLEMVRKFFEIPFDGGRHERRVNKLDQT